MSNEGPSKSEQDPWVCHIVSVLRRTQGLSVLEAMQSGGFNDTEGKDHALQMCVYRALKPLENMRKTWLITLDNKAENPPPNAKTPSEQLITTQAAQRQMN